MKLSANSGVNTTSGFLARAFQVPGDTSNEVVIAYAGTTQEMGMEILESGTVVQPGIVMLTLVPQDDVLTVEVWVSNEDIGFVRPGQAVKLKFAAFPFQKYGMAEGTVERVAVDAADSQTGGGGTNVDRNGRPMPLVYKALVSMKSSSLAVDGHRYPLTAGMQASAEILLGDRTVAEYMLSPVQKAWHEAARER